MNIDSIAIPANSLSNYEKQIYDLKQLLEISKSLSSVLEIKKVIESMLYICMCQMRTLSAALFTLNGFEANAFTLDSNYNGMELASDINYSVPVDHPAIQLLESTNMTYTYEEMVDILKSRKEEIFDTHAHIGLIYNDPIEQLRVLQEARKANVTRIVSICNSLHDFGKVYNNLKSLPYVYHAVGVAPSEVVNPGKDWIQTIEASVKLPNVVAIGETGLDYFKKYGDKTSQIELFITQLELAEKYNLPVIIHNREAGKDVLDILRDRIPSAGAVLHCYSENAAYAKEA